MKITLLPQFGLPGSSTAQISVSGDTVTVDGVPYDLSAVPEGGVGEWADSLVVGEIERISGVLHLSLLCRLGQDIMDVTTSISGDWIVEVSDGAIDVHGLMGVG